MAREAVDFYPDVLDHMGKTPREFGDVHAHLEEVARGPGEMRGVATVLLQAAFEPMSGSARLRFLASGADELDTEVARFDAPPLDRGAVVRVRYPLALPAAANQVFLRVDASVARGAQRVRPAWRLFDTIEIKTLSEMEELEHPIIGWFDDVEGPFRPDPEPPGVLQRNLDELRTVRHKARELPPGLLATVVEKQVRAARGPEIEVLWKPGMALPEAPAAHAWQDADTVSRVPPPSATRRCRQCGFEGKRAEYESSRFCPVCDAAWD